MMAKKEQTLASGFRNMTTNRTSTKRRGLPKFHAQMAYQSIYRASAQYPLSTTYATKEELDKVSRKSTRAIIGALGVNRSFPRTIAFAPKSVLGLGMTHHHLSQWMQQIKQMIACIRQGDDNGKIYLATLEHTQLLAGTTLATLKHPSYPLHHLQEPFFIELRKFLAENQLSIDIPALHIPQPQRQDDICIMDALQDTKLTKKEWRAVNQCRLYLKAFWTSDIATVDGTHLENTAMSPTSRTQSRSYSTLTWPYQERPPPQSWTTWRRILRRVFLVEKGGNSSSTELAYKPGPFYKRSKRYRIWEYEIETKTSPTIIYSPSNNFGPIYRLQIEKRRRLWKVQLSNFHVTPESNATYPVAVKERGQSTTVIYPAQHVPVHTLDTEPEYRINWTQRTLAMTACDRWERQILPGNKIDMPKSILSQLDPNNIVLFVASKNHGPTVGFSWIIFNILNGNPIASGTNITPSSHEHTTLSQGCLTGIYAGLRVLTVLFADRRFDVINLVYSDKECHRNLVKMKRLRRHSPRWRLNRYFEVLNGIHSLIGGRKLSTQLYSEDTPAISPHFSQCTTLLDNFLARTSAFGIPKQPSKHCVIALLWEKKQINSRYDEQLHTSYSTRAVREYHTKKFDWDAPTYHQIHWEALKYVGTRCNINKRIMLAKYVYNWLPIDTKLERIDPMADTSCQSCGAIETHNHLWTCNSEKRQQTRTQFISALEDLCRKHKMHSSHRQQLLNAVRKWLRTEESRVRIPTGTENSTAAILRSQNQIGWQHFFRGRITKQIQAHINASRQTPVLNSYESMKWTTQVIDLIWTTTTELWNIRNKDRHGDTEEEQIAVKKQRMRERIEELYVACEALSPRDKKDILPDKDRLLNKSLTNMEIWYETTQRTVNHLLRLDTVADDDPEN